MAQPVSNPKSPDWYRPLRKHAAYSDMFRDFPSKPIEPKLHPKEMRTSSPKLHPELHLLQMTKAPAALLPTKSQLV